MPRAQPTATRMARTADDREDDSGMALRFYNTLTRSLAPFVPIEPGFVRMHASRPTVYQLPHIGNYRTFLFNHPPHRYLDCQGYDVTVVTNVTGVDANTP